MKTWNCFRCSCRAGARLPLSGSCVMCSTEVSGRTRAAWGLLGRAAYTLDCLTAGLAAAALRSRAHRQTWRLRVLTSSLQLGRRALACFFLWASTAQPCSTGGCCMRQEAASCFSTAARPVGPVSGVRAAVRRGVCGSGCFVAHETGTKDSRCWGRQGGSFAYPGCCCLSAAWWGEGQLRCRSATRGGREACLQYAASRLWQAIKLYTVHVTSLVFHQ